jgi:formylglycine-generating enzyme required for sulfatase activity
LRAEAGRKLALLPNPDPQRFTCADHRHAACANLRTPEGVQAYEQDGFVAISAKGKTFTMQAGSKAAGQVTLDHDYRIGKTPVTYAQFEAFVDDVNGYRNNAHWTQAGLAWRRNRTQPESWQDPKWHIANHPVIGVSWYEAYAFCNWLSEQFKTLKALEAFRVYLPTELEWEYASRRDTGRRYPWKKGLDDTWAQGDEARCNVSETGLGRTSAVGIFADGATPDGIYDLTGNVWEWQGTTWDNDWRKVKAAPEGEVPRGLRGGSWAGNHEVDLGSRGRGYPDLRDDFVGFRVVVRAHFSF